MSEPLDMPTLRVAFETAFPGCVADLSKGVGVSSHHVDVKFHEFEVRVIMSRIAADGQRDMECRVRQLIPTGQRIVKVVRSHVKSRDPGEILQAVKDARGLLLGHIFALNQALYAKPPQEVSTIEDLFKEQP